MMKTVRRSRLQRWFNCLGVLTWLSGLVYILLGLLVEDKWKGTLWWSHYGSSLTSINRDMPDDPLLNQLGFVPDPMLFPQVSYCEVILKFHFFGSRCI